jgi:hypothetical protein
MASSSNENSSSLSGDGRTFFAGGSSVSESDGNSKLAGHSFRLLSGSREFAEGPSAWAAAWSVFQVEKDALDFYSARGTRDVFSAHIVVGTTEKQDEFN